MPAHKDDSEVFRALSYGEQASSLTSQVQNLKRQILAHREKALAEGKEDSTSKFLNQLKQLVIDLENL